MNASEASCAAAPTPSASGEATALSIAKAPGSSDAPSHTGENGEKEDERRKRRDLLDVTSLVSTGNGKRAQNPSDDSHTKKSARRDEPANLKWSNPVNHAATKERAETFINLIQHVQDGIPRQFGMRDFGDVHRLKATAEMKLNMITREWSDAQASTNEQESRLAEILAHTAAPRNGEELREVLENKIEAKKAVEKAKALFEQHMNDMALGLDLVSQAMAQYETKLRECVEGIAQAEADIQRLEKESSTSKQQVEKVRRQLKRKQADVELFGDFKFHYTLEFDYYRTIEGLIKLGPYGLDILTQILAEKGL
ncbi:hypothetical protein N0V84_007055 [Fusarium piperis]|uniref:Uncharacterized protein n=1 Tax=Fusarium piperis TaxID=1435070 RepID=A0A9W9BMW3_9HYPO|nr:hypothetical protein N0V84_007055 [Fusarium piperis]